MFHPKVRDVKIWFSKLNKQIFNNKLPEVDLIEIRRRYKVHAECVQTCDGESVHFAFIMNNKFDTFEQFLEILGHEMVHLYQFNKGYSFKHNKVFFSFRDKFKKNGLRLMRHY